MGYCLICKTHQDSPFDCDCRTPEPNPVQRSFTITNIYEDGEEVITHGTCGIDPDLYVNDEKYRQDIEQEDIFNLTGTGKTKGNAGYFVESDDGLEPAISVEFV